MEIRVERAVSLIERFEKNSRMVEKCVWQDEKDFPLDFPREIFSWSTKKKEQEHDCNKIQKLMST